MSEKRQLGDGVELVCEDYFLPNRNWSIRRGDMVWSRVEGWRKHYEVKRSIKDGDDSQHDGRNALENKEPSPPRQRPPMYS